MGKASCELPENKRRPDALSGHGQALAGGVSHPEDSRRRRLDHGGRKSATMDLEARDARSEGFEPFLQPAPAAIAGDTDPAVVIGGKDPRHPTTELRWTEPKVKAFALNRNRDLHAQAQASWPQSTICEHRPPAGSVDEHRGAERALSRDDLVVVSMKDRSLQEGCIGLPDKAPTQGLIVEGRKRVPRYDSCNGSAAPVNDQLIVDLFDGVCRTQALQHWQWRCASRGLSLADRLAIKEQDPARSGQFHGRSQPAEAGSHNDGIPFAARHFYCRLRAAGRRLQCEMKRGVRAA